jgi:hypothetical protein
MLEYECMATVLDRLHDQLGEADESAYDRALRVLAAALPLDRQVELTEEIVRAAAAGDVFLISTLLAPEEDPEPGESEALAEADAMDDGSRVDIATVRRELGLRAKE